jgi:hypothetical protein
VEDLDGFDQESIAQAVVMLRGNGLATFLYGISAIPGHGTVADCHI